MTGMTGMTEDAYATKRYCGIVACTLFPLDTMRFGRSLFSVVTTRRPIAGTVAPLILSGCIVIVGMEKLSRQTI